MSQGGEPAMEWERRNAHNVLTEKYLRKQSLGRSMIWLDTIKVDFRSQKMDTIGSGSCPVAGCGF